MEKVLYTSRTHPKALARVILIQLILLAFHLLIINFWPDNVSWSWLDKWGEPVLHGLIIILEIWYVVVPFLRWRNDRFTVTTERVRNEWGILYKQSREIDLSRISSISEERGILDRIFGAGTLNFYDAAANAQPNTGGAWNDSKKSNYGIRFTDVPRVKEVRKLIEQARYGINATDDPDA